MCTVSWLFEEQRYHVFFNRDEQRTRPKAWAPRRFNADLCSTIMPVDPLGGGSWLSTNTAGITLALLNFYQGHLPKGKLTSRGQVVQRLSSLVSVSAIENTLHSLTLEGFAPFSLLVFTPDGARGTEVPMWRWDGMVLVKQMQGSPLISSARCYDKVVAARMAIYREAIVSRENKVTVESFYRLHRLHGDKPSATSICMHREDARTVSFSHIEVSPAHAHFHYLDGAPCSRAGMETLTLER
ncbi:NRDE family protein [Teredinibacter haidensis]|uniref:NRDE family protein n=1 Tax=Teredinibacter haidensis TaxID=2731755 RepID=UPI0009488A2B|nr:NRDE family protein [Teredinibacter haidensis]